MTDSVLAHPDLSAKASPTGPAGPTGPTGPTDPMVTMEMMVTPDRARKWLATMPAQRRVRRARLAMLVRQIEQGSWRLLPHGLVVDRQGRLIDGQHRCLAILESGRSLPMRVTFNAESDMFGAIDSATAPKDLADALKVLGVPTGICPICAKATRMAFRVAAGKSPFEQFLQPTNNEGVETFLANASIMEAGELARTCRMIVPSQGILTYYLHLGLEHHAPLTRDFARKLATSVGLNAGDPELLVRNTFIKDRASRVVRMETDQAVIIATGLNARFRGRTLMSWRNVEFGKGKVPVIGAFSPGRG